MSKELVANALAKKVKDQELIGLGSGSTTELAIKEIGKRIKNEKIIVYGVPTSKQTAIVATEAGIVVVAQPTDRKIVWGFDGADEVDPAFNLIKGRGACMLNEKIMAKQVGGNWLVVVTEDKIVSKLGEKFPVPIEIIPDAYYLVRDELKKLGAKEIVLRMATSKYGPTISENNNLILDVRFEKIEQDFENRINQITGVVENGLFINFNPEVLLVKQNEVWSKKLVSGKVQEEKVL